MTLHRYRPLRVVIVGIVAMLSKEVFAEGADLLSLSLEELLQAKVTSSTLTEESIQTVPSSITLFTRADIHRLGLKNLPQLLNMVPGYQSYRTDASSLILSLSSRGRRLGNVGSEVLILIDGQRLNNDWAGGASQSDSLISLEHVERVEFIRGPGSSIYGSNALMGVINIITGRHRQIVAEVGSFGNRHASAQWFWQSEIGSLAIYAKHSESDGENLQIYEPFSKPEAPVFVNTRDPFQTNDVYLRAEVGEFSFAARSSQRRQEDFYAYGYVDNNSNLNRSWSDSVSVGWHRSFAEGLSLEGNVHNNHKSFRVISAASLVPYLLIDGIISEQELGTEWLLKGNYDQSNWLVGMEWRNPRLVDTDAHFGPPENSHLINVLQAPENGRVINGLFGQYKTHLTPAMELTLGLRRDSYSDFGSHLSPRVGLVQQWNEKNTIKLLYSEAFRAPARVENSIINVSAFEKNPDLKPETSKTAELVWIHLLAEGYISTSLYNTYVKDAIVDDVTSQLRRKPSNSQQSVAGLEVEWQKVWTENWQSRVALTQIFDPVGYLHTESNRLLSGSLSYQKNAWTLSLSANYQSTKRDPNEQDFPVNIVTTEYTEFGGYSVFNAHLSYMVQQDMELYFHVDNLLNKQYLVPASRPANYIGVPSSGRLVSAGLRWTFN